MARGGWIRESEEGESRKEVGLWDDNTSRVGSPKTPHRTTCHMPHDTATQSIPPFSAFSFSFYFSF